MSGEVWKPIHGYEGLYEISNLGRVKSISKRFAKEKILKQAIDRYGYSKVVLYKSNKPHYFTVHRLVATTFIENPNKKKTVDHIDCNKQNNSVENLRWATVKENLYHSHKAGNQIINATPIIATNPSGERFFFDSQREAERITGVKQYAISRVLHGKNHNAEGWCFEYDSFESFGGSCRMVRT